MRRLRMNRFISGLVALLLLVPSLSVRAAQAPPPDDETTYSAPCDEACRVAREKEAAEIIRRAHEEQDKKERDFGLGFVIPLGLYTLIGGGVYGLERILEGMKGAVVVPREILENFRNPL